MTTARPKILIIEATFYPQIAEELREGAIAAIDAEGAAVARISVPGVLEIPAALAMAIDVGERNPSRAFDAFVLLGCVIRGETTHYDIVAGESARAVMDLAVAHRIPLGNGILTVEDEEQAHARSRADRKDKGGDAARAALAMIAVKRHLAGEAN